MFSSDEKEVALAKLNNAGLLKELRAERARVKALVLVLEEARVELIGRGERIVSRKAQNALENAGF